MLQAEGRKKTPYFNQKEELQWDFGKGKCKVLVCSRDEASEEEDLEVAKEGEGGFWISRSRAGLFAFGRWSKGFEFTVNFFPLKKWNDNKMEV